MKKRTFVAMVLDQSGSMEAIRTETIQAFNEQVDIIKSMQTEDMEVLLTLVTFATGARVTFANQTVDHIKKLDKDTYQPYGLTAMYDGVGLAIDTIIHEDEQVGDAYLVSIVSDGMENSSQKVTSATLASRIKELQLKGNWTFTYLGANQDLSMVAKNTGIAVGNMGVFLATPDGMVQGSTKYNQSLSAYTMSRACGMTATQEFFHKGNDSDKE